MGSPRAVQDGVALPVSYLANGAVVAPADGIVLDDEVCGADFRRLRYRRLDDCRQ
jgi:hypothetical protein